MTGTLRLPTSRLARCWALAVVSLAAVASFMGAQAPRLAVLRGSVLSDSSDLPLRGAEVGIPELGLLTRTDSSGQFRLAGIPAGRRIVIVRLLGFAPVSHVLTFAAADSTETEFTLVPTMQKLAGVTVKAAAPVVDKLADFERRRAAGFGHFLTRDILAKNENRQLGELMSTIPGNWVQRSRNSNTSWVVGGRGTQSFLRNCSVRDISDLVKGANCNCYAAVFLDGALVYGGNDGELLFDINSIQPRDIAGVEYYSGPATTPPEFNGTRLACGTVVIWTRVK
jgi:TonB-dependent starch-binding outer membrane protein SusC